MNGLRFSQPFISFSVIDNIFYLTFGDNIVVDYEGINKINTGEGNDKVSTSDFKDFDIDGDGDYSDTMTDFIGFETDENPEI